jgi:hypothetical protein
MRNEAKLRLSIRDLYRGNGGTLNELDQGWNEGVEAAAEIFNLIVPPSVTEEWVQERRKEAYKLGQVYSTPEAAIRATLAALNIEVTK